MRPCRKSGTTRTDTQGRQSLGRIRVTPKQGKLKPGIRAARAIYEAPESYFRNRFVKGHGFSRAVKTPIETGL
jgi:hypothetical protein